MKLFRRRPRRPSYREVVPADVRALAEGVGLPEPTWYDGRLDLRPVTTNPGKDGQQHG